MSVCVSVCARSHVRTLAGPWLTRMSPSAILWDMSEAPPLQRSSLPAAEVARARTLPQQVPLRSYVRLRS